MIDSYSFKVIGEIVSLSAQGDILKLDILSIIPTENDSDTWLGRHHIKRKVDIHSISYGKGVEKTRVIPGTLIIGDFMSIETEVHGQGYRVHNTLKIESIFPGKNAKSYFQGELKQLKNILSSGNIAGRINVVLIAREFELQSLSPAILRTMESLYPKGEWQPGGVKTFYYEAIENFSRFKYKDSVPLLKKIVADKENTKIMGSDFEIIQKDARETLEKLGYVAAKQAEVSSDIKGPSASKTASLFGVGLGMSRSRADDFLGRGTYLGSAGKLAYYSYHNGTKVIGFTSIDSRALVLWTSDPAYNVEGVAVNDSADRVKKILGQAESVESAGDSLYWYYPSRNIMIQLSHKTNKVSGIQVYKSSEF